ncbi:MAG: hypothetical protein WC637_02075 [Victivallales bacterium]|jgi:hypothetical protein
MKTFIVGLLMVAGIVGQNLAMAEDGKPATGQGFTELTTWVTVDGKEQSFDKFLKKETVDGKEFSHITIDPSLITGKLDSNSHRCGIMGKLKVSAQKGEKVKMSFTAKSLSGSNNLSMVRPGGGTAFKMVQLNDKLAKYDVTIDNIGHETTSILFTTVADPNGLDIQPAVKGEFLIGDFVVEIVK